MSLSCCDIVQSLTSPEELHAIGVLLLRKLSGGELTGENEAERFCYGSLKKVSRSFAGVVMQLEGDLRRAVCVFYLVLRALDTVEDDMAVSVEEKTPELLSFHEKLNLPEYTVKGVGYGYEKLLLENYTEVLSMYHTLPEPYCAVIKSITQQMGEGMVSFLTKPVNTVADYDQYCFYVAGLVGHGLSDLWSAAGCATNTSREVQTSMGLFLQKVNIIRDYLEDITDTPPRCYWPKEVWGQYASELADFADPCHINNAVACLDHLIGNALCHVPHCLEYMRGVTDEKVFIFCAIPQVMAIATLSTLYGNADVFRRRVKISKGTSAVIVTQSTSMPLVLNLFKRFLGKIAGKSPTHASGITTRQKAIDLITACDKFGKK